MKKFYILLAFTGLLLSCSNSDENASPNQPNPNLLQRVDFYPGTSVEKRWLFNTDGLLEKITKADGTVLQHYSYDSQDRLIMLETFYSDGSPAETINYTYDANGIVTSANGMALTYDATTSTYTYGNTNTYYSSFTVNSEKLLTHSKSAYMDDDGSGNLMEVVTHEMGIGYTNNNMISYWKDDTCHSFTFDSKTNPLRNATLSICKTLSSFSYDPWVDVNCVSVNNIASREYCPEDPESEMFHYTYNSNNLPVIQTRDDYYLGTYEDTSTTIKYYYQGDTLP